MADTSLIFNIIAKDKTKAAFEKFKGAAAVAGAAAGAALAAGVIQAVDKSKIDGVLSAQLGATPAQAAQLGKLSGEVYAAGFGEDMPMVASAIKDAAQQGFIDMNSLADSATKSTVQKLLTVAQVVGDETDRVSAAVSSLLKTGMAKSAEEAMDLIVAATQRGVNKSGDLLDTFEEYSTLFRSLGLTGAQSVGLMSQALAAGARNADQVADGLKELSIRAIDGSKAARDAYKLLGLDADTMIKKIAAGGPQAAQGMDQILDALRRMDDPVKQNTAGVGLLGTKWEDMRDAVLAMDLTSATNSLNNVAGAANRAGDAIQKTAGQRLERFKRQAQMALVETLAKAVPHIEATFGWLSRNSSWVVPLAAGLGMLVAVIWLIVTATKIWTAVQTAFNIVMAMNPVVLIIVAILALVAAIVLIATKTTWFQDLWHWIWGKIGDPVKKVWNWIKANWPLLLAIITGPIGWAVGLVVKYWDEIKAATGAVKDWIVNKFLAVVNFFKTLPGKMRSAARGLFDGVKSAFKSAVNWIIGKWNNLSLRIGGGTIMGVKIPSITLSTPNLPYLAKGGTAVTGGLAIVGENGPELLNLTPGAEVRPLTDTPRAVPFTPRPAGGGGGTNVPRSIRLETDNTDLGRFLQKVIRRVVIDQGGDVQLVLGARS